MANIVQLNDRVGGEKSYPVTIGEAVLMDDAGTKLPAALKAGYGTSMSAAANALKLLNGNGVALATLTAANLVTILGSTAVNLANALISQDLITTAEAMDAFHAASKVMYANFKTYTPVGFAGNDGLVLSISWSSASYAVQIAFDESANGTIAVRGLESGTWGNWYKVLHAGNFVAGTNYPSLTGAGASGTWGININGNAATATSATSATKLGTATVGSNENPVYINGGSPTAVTKLKANLISGGFNYVGNNTTFVGIGPAFNCNGYAVEQGATVKFFLDGVELAMTDNGNFARSLFDGLASSAAQPFSMNIQSTYGPYVAGKTYAVNELCSYTPQGASKVMWYRCIAVSTGNLPTNTRYWEDVSATGNYVGVNPKKFSSFIIEVKNLPKTIAYENGLALYWRVKGQHPNHVSIEKYDSTNDAWYMVVQNGLLEGPADTFYLGLGTNTGVQNGIRLTFTDFTSENYWGFALSQIAFTGMNGSLEGTVLFRSGGNVYGNITPFGSGVSLGSSSKKWANVYAEMVEASSFKKTGGTSAQFLKADGSVDSNVYLTAHQSLSAYAKLASPTFTGTPKAPTAAAGTNSTQIATTAFVKTAVGNAGDVKGPSSVSNNAIAVFDGTTGKLIKAGGKTLTELDNAIANLELAITPDTLNTVGATDTASKIFLVGVKAQGANPQSYSHDTAYVGTDGCLYSGGAKVLTAHQSLAAYATLASPALTGTPTAPTAAAGTNSTQIATTAFVKAAVEAASAGASVPDNIVTTDATAFPTGGVALWSATARKLTTCGSFGNSTSPIYLEDGIPKVCAYTDTVAATNNTGKKLYLVGATAQSRGMPGYSNIKCYIGSDNCLYSNSLKVATLSSPALTGTPTAPTPAADCNNTQLATTAFVHTAVGSVRKLFLCDYLYGLTNGATINTTTWGYDLTGDDGLLAHVAAGTAVLKKSTTQTFDSSRTVLIDVNVGFHSGALALYYDEMNGNQVFRYHCDIRYVSGAFKVYKTKYSYTVSFASY